MVIWNPGCINKYEGPGAINSEKEKMKRITESQNQTSEKP